MGFCVLVVIFYTVNEVCGGWLWGIWRMAFLNYIFTALVLAFPLSEEASIRAASGHLAMRRCVDGTAQAPTRVTRYIYTYTVPYLQIRQQALTATQQAIVQTT